MIDDSQLEAALAAANLPGAVCAIVDREGTRYSRAFGHADTLAGTQMREDTVCQIASMTKAIVSVGAMQLVEQGHLSLDGPIGDVLPELAKPRVITGFGDDGAVQTRAAARPVTLRHLLTHTSGFGYAFVQPEVLRYYQSVGMPAPGTLDSLRMPLLFDPGEAWEYGVSTDWVGQAIEAATGTRLGDYLQAYVFAPLGMSATAFFPVLPEGAAKVHTRGADGSLKTLPINLGGGEFQSGGGGLSSTAPDYARFTRMILRGGELDGARIISAETVAEMSRNQIGPIRAGYMGTAMPDLAQPFDSFPDQHTGWGLGFLINPQAGPNGRSPGSLAWAGIFNSYYWIDPHAGVAGVFMSQLSPFGDPGALACFGALERMAYQ
jgi:CubicO group peptidase (beta-lactamase class C family)